jgi:hypothetical protein
MHVSREVRPSAPADVLRPPASDSFWTYQGVAITIDRKGTFCSRLQGVALSENSLDAIKQKIDALLIFDPFRALYIGGGEVRHLIIIGIKTARDGRQWIDKSGTLHRRVLRNSSENAAKLDAYLKARTEEFVRIENERKKIAAMLDGLPWETPMQIAPCTALRP